MPENVASGEVFKVVLVIDDPQFRELTRKIVVRTEGTGDITLRGPGDIYELFEREYSGEEKIVFDAVLFSGMRDGDKECTLSIQFKGDLAELKEKYLELNIYEENLGKVSKKIRASPMSFSAELPETPEGSNSSDSVNHDGFLNPNMADSYTEGFAEFMALAISDRYGDTNPADGKGTKPEIYASFGSLDNNYRPWDSKGYLEEFAIASLLWDMYDSSNGNGDSLTMSIDNIWEVLKVKRADFHEYYAAFRQGNPKKSF